MRQLSNFILTCVLFVGVSTFEVQQTLTLIRPEAVDSHQGPAQQLVSPSLEKFGSKTVSSHAEQPPDAHPNGVRTIMQRFLSQHLTMSSSRQTSNSNTFFTTILFCWVLIAVFFLAAWTWSSEASDVPEETNRVTLENTDSSWACKYRESKGEDKEALALLLRCNIISKQELADNDISQEHIAECLWIAQTMLKKKTSEEWAALSENGPKEAFEEAVAAVFQAKPTAPSSDAAETHVQFSTHVVEIHDPEEALKRDSSTVSLGSNVSFQLDEQNKQASVPAPGSAGCAQKSPFPTKSPVPVVNCFHQDELASSQGSTNNGEAEEEVFSSVFSSSIVSSTTFSSSNASPPLSQFSSPQESQKAPESPYDYSNERLLRTPTWKLAALLEKPERLPRDPQAAPPRHTQVSTPQVAPPRDAEDTLIASEVAAAAAAKTAMAVRREAAEAAGGKAPGSPWSTQTPSWRLAAWDEMPPPRDMHAPGSPNEPFSSTRLPAREVMVIPPPPPDVKAPDVKAQGGSRLLLSYGSPAMPKSLPDLHGSPSTSMRHMQSAPSL